MTGDEGQTGRPDTVAQGQGTIPARKRGLPHLLAATAYSGAGLRRLWRESAFRQELALGAVLLAGLALWGVAPSHLVILLVLLLVLVAVEALNTAIEEVVDRLSPGWSEFARDAKDLGSLAAGAILAAIAVVAIWALFA